MAETNIQSPNGSADEHRTWLSVDVVAIIAGDPLQVALIRRA